MKHLVQTNKFLVLAVVEENKLSEIASHELEFRDLIESIGRQNYDVYQKRFQFGWVSTHSWALLFRSLRVFFSLSHR